MSRDEAVKMLTKAQKAFEKYRDTYSTTYIGNMDHYISEALKALQAPPPQQDDREAIISEFVNSLPSPIQNAISFCADFSETTWPFCVVEGCSNRQTKGSIHCFPHDRVNKFEKVFPNPEDAARAAQSDVVRVKRTHWEAAKSHLSWLAEDSKKYKGTDAWASAKRVWDAIKSAEGK